MKNKKIDRFYATGRRKTSVARVWVSYGTGKITVNDKTADEYFTSISHIKSIITPLEITNNTGKIDIWCTVVGGGHSGQAGAITLGVARAMDSMNRDANHVLLRKNGLLTRDPRSVERKKYGKHGARRSTQFSKR